jgi:hypothetical protein
MQHKDSLVWFARGFAGMALIALLAAPLVLPNHGWAQATGSLGKQAVAVTPNPLEMGADGGLLGPTIRLDVKDPGFNTSELAGPASIQETGSDQPGGDGLAPAAATSGNYSSPLVIPAADFSSSGANPGNTFFFFGDEQNPNGGYVRGIASGVGCLKAPAYLPDGGLVDSFYAYVYDNESTYTVSVGLNRVRLSTGVHDLMASVATTGITDTIQYLGDVTVSPNVVSNQYSYYVTTCLNGDKTRLYATRIFYHLP